MSFDEVNDLTFYQAAILGGAWCPEHGPSIIKDDKTRKGWR